MSFNHANAWHPLRIASPVLDAHVVFPGQLGHGGRYAINFAPSRNPAVTGEPLSFEDDASFRWLFRRVGLDSRYYRPDVLRRRIPGVLRALRVTSLAAARAAVERTPHLAREAIGSLVLGVTHFFRDSETFDALRDRVLPELARRDGDARLWSVGCSDGAELYSVAILLAEQGVLHRRTLLGTDCRAAATASAATGIFDKAAVAAVPPHLLGKYLRPHGSGYRIVPWLAAVPQWRTADALSVIEPGQWDLILCRNMAIYLQPHAVGQLWTQLHDALRPGGVLVTGKAERPGAGFGFTPIGPSIYCRERS